MVCRKRMGSHEKACGMTSLGSDATKQGLVYFELTAEQAEELLLEGNNDD